MIACVYSPPVRQRPAEPDTAPWYFPGGVVPSPQVPVSVDLSAGESRSFGLQVFDTSVNEGLTYVWTLIVPELNIVQSIASGTLGSPQTLGSVVSWQVPSIRLETCQSLFKPFLEQQGDSLSLELSVVDAIPEDQRFDPGAVAYELLVRWDVQAVGNCE